MNLYILTPFDLSDHHSFEYSYDQLLCLDFCTGNCVFGQIVNFWYRRLQLRYYGFIITHRNSEFTNGRGDYYYYNYRYFTFFTLYQWDITRQLPVPVDVINIRAYSKLTLEFRHTLPRSAPVNWIKFWWGYHTKVTKFPKDKLYRIKQNFELCY